MNSHNPVAVAAMGSSLSHPDADGGVRVDTVPSVQPVTAPLTCAAIFLVVTIDEGGETQVHDALADLPGMASAISFRDPTKQLSLVISIGSDAWDRLFTGPRPAELHPFVELVGPRHTAPATPGDLLFHIRGETMDVCFELARRILRTLRGAVTVADEVHGFRFFDNRDLLGFVDGTENPTGDDALAVTAVGDEDPDFAGGCYVHIQKYLHDMTAWDALAVDDQERVIGRTKADDIEFDDADKPANAHIKLNVITDDDGNELDIVRANMPFGTANSGDHGTYYIGYSRSPQVTELMLRNMFLGDPPGVTDRILDFSTALTGGLFFAPSTDFLDDPPPLPGSATPAPAITAEPTSPEGEGSLNIGSLKGISQ